MTTRSSTEPPSCAPTGNLYPQVASERWKCGRIEVWCEYKILSETQDKRRLNTL